MGGYSEVRLTTAQFEACLRETAAALVGDVALGSATRAFAARIVLHAVRDPAARIRIVPAGRGRAQEVREFLTPMIGLLTTPGFEATGLPHARRRQSARTVLTRVANAHFDPQDCEPSIRETVKRVVADLVREHRLTRSADVDRQSRP